MRKERVEQQDVERIARATLKDLGITTDVTVVPEQGHPGEWRVEMSGQQAPPPLRVRCGPGSTAKWVRDQILEQFLA